MKALFKLCPLLFAATVVTSAAGSPASDFINENVAHAANQYRGHLDTIDSMGHFVNPRTTLPDGSIWYVPVDDWCSGFFPGSLWYLGELTGDQDWSRRAADYTETLDSAQYLTWHHDVGFIIGSSYLNGYRLGGKEQYAPVVVNAAKSLATRFRPGAGVIQSWNVDKGWQSERGWACPVIIDNMMNLEIMFEATRLTGDSTFYDIAVSHANTTMAHHFRPDFSCYHVVDYDPATGDVRHRQTAQGYADESSWARGQAWALYGYTMCYRYTGDPNYIYQAIKVCDMIFNTPSMPDDLVPYWDYNAPNIPSEPRDASAAACTASALYELSTYLPGRGYKELADKVVASLSSPAYRAATGENNHFLLMHSVGSIPHGHEIDVPINYADYYYLEALLRKKKLDEGCTKLF
jgi:hypothetical protein